MLADVQSQIRPLEQCASVIAARRTAPYSPRPITIQENCTRSAIFTIFTMLLLDLSILSVLTCVPHQYWWTANGHNEYADDWWEAGRFANQYISNSALNRSIWASEQMTLYRGTSDCPMRRDTFVFSCPLCENAFENPLNVTSYIYDTLTKIGCECKRASSVVEGRNSSIVLFIRFWDMIKEHKYKNITIIG